LIGGRYFNAHLTWNGQLGNDLVVSGQAKLKQPADFRVIGRSPRRKDLPLKVFRQARHGRRCAAARHAACAHDPAQSRRRGARFGGRKSIADIPGAEVVWIKNLLAVVAPKEWNAVRASEKLKVTWSDSAPHFPGMRSCTSTSAKRRC
jgi:hypothetical protein